MSWLWRIACNYLRIIAHGNTISPTYNVSCCKISVKFISWLRIKRKKQKHIFSKIIELVLFFSWTCWPFKTVFYHVFGFCVINGLINRRKICRYFSYSPIYRLSPRKPNIPFNVLFKRKFPHVIFQDNSFPEKAKTEFFIWRLNFFFLGTKWGLWTEKKILYFLCMFPFSNYYSHQIYEQKITTKSWQDIWWSHIIVYAHDILYAIC